MIIAFLGKGGSGKSTLSYRFAEYLARKKKNVLAIDADHNMDMIFNFGLEDLPQYLGQGMSDFKNYTDISQSSKHYEVFSKSNLPIFSIDPQDDFTKKYSKKINGCLSVMATGPHTDNILYGKECSHVLGTVLKGYLPLIDLKENDWVVVDEKASRDSVGTGVTTGFNMAMICVEPTAHSVKAGNQIAELLDFYSTPYEFIINKIESEADKKIAFENLVKSPKFFITYDKNFLKEENYAQFDGIVETCEKYVKENGDYRLEATKQKLEKNREFALAGK